MYLCFTVPSVEMPLSYGDCHAVYSQAVSLCGSKCVHVDVQLSGHIK